MLGLLLVKMQIRIDSGNSHSTEDKLAEQYAHIVRSASKHLMKETWTVQKLFGNKLKLHLTKQNSEPEMKHIWPSDHTTGRFRKRFQRRMARRIEPIHRRNHRPRTQRRQGGAARPEQETKYTIWPIAWERLPAVEQRVLRRRQRSIPRTRRRADHYHRL